MVNIDSYILVDAESDEVKLPFQGVLEGELSSCIVAERSQRLPGKKV